MSRHRVHSGAGRRCLAFGFLTTSLVALTRAEAGHESPWYPSFYPQEIRIEAVDPGPAAALLESNSLHVYVGSDPFAGRPTPPTIKSVDAIGSYLVATFNPASPSLRDSQHRCTAGREILSRLAGGMEPFILHPYPVTPYHADYLHHADLAQGWAKITSNLPAKGRPSGQPALRVKAAGRLAEMVARAGWTPAEREWDAAFEEVDVAALLSSHAYALNGWLGPPWVKEGWFHAYLLLSSSIHDAARKQRVEAIYERLVSGAYDGTVEKLNLERTLVSLLTQGCERVVLGYSTKRAYFNNDYSEGVENIGHDSHSGFVASIFIRTVKLKDFPWNGWLRLGIEGKPGSAWNPIGGFTDSFGRLLWAAIGDPALLPAPYSGSWVANRVTAMGPPGDSTSGKLDVPDDAFRPEPGTGLLQKLGPGNTARAKILYKVPASAFHDGTRMTVADLVYPYAFAARWGVKRGQDGRTYDPAIEESTAVMRKWFAGFKVLRVEEAIRDLGDLKLEWQVPVIEVYVRQTLLDPQQTAAVAPPWSSLPWHLLVLMEEAVTRGFAAFSQGEAKRRGVAWLDMVRDQALHGRLALLVEEFERAGYVPEGLRGWATPEEARQRWGALRQFAQKHRHLLVTNGPYLLEKWSADAVVLQVFRDLSYPLGVGTFDGYALPPKAYISKAEPRGTGLQISAEIEKAQKAQRTYTMVREPLRKDAMSGGYPIQAVASYVALAPDGRVRSAGTARFGDDATFTVDLKDLKGGRYTILVAIYLNGNRVNPDVRIIPYRAGR